MKTINKIDLSYIAAFLDTDGCVTASFGRKTKAGYRIAVPMIIFYNRDLNVLKWIQSLLGGKIYNKKRTDRKHSIARQLFLRRQKEEVFTAIKLLLPFMKIKKKQGGLLLSYLQSRIDRGYKYGKHLPPTEEETKMVLKIRALNQNRLFKNNQE